MGWEEWGKTYVRARDILRHEKTETKESDESVGETNIPEVSRSRTTTTTYGGETATGGSPEGSSGKAVPEAEKNNPILDLVKKIAKPVKK